jgi:ribonuclease P protein component
VQQDAGELRQIARLKESKDFRRISRDGVRKASTHFIAIVGKQRPTPGQASVVLGITVSKKVGTAVERNRVKRRIREWFRHNWTALPADVGVVVIARRGAARLSSAEVERQLRGLLL